MLSRLDNGSASEPTPSTDDPALTDEAHENAHRINETVAMAATVGVVAVGVALFEVALLPGMVIGVAAMLVPKYLPQMGAAFTPMLKSTFRTAYKFGQKTREMVADAKEQVDDIVAEVHAEGDVALKPVTELQKA